MAQYGGSFLEASVGPPLRRLCMDKIAIEVDPVRSGKSARNTEKNVEQLVYWCQEFWNCIYDARTQCPQYVLVAFSVQNDSSLRSAVKCDGYLSTSANLSSNGAELASIITGSFRGKVCLRSASCGLSSLRSCIRIYSDFGQVRTQL